MTVVHDDLLLDTAMLVLLDFWLVRPWARADAAELCAEMGPVRYDEPLLSRAQWRLKEIVGQEVDDDELRADIEHLLVDARLLELKISEGAQALMAREREWT